MAKKKATKLKSKKLEDRIAPGMVGGGLIDPGMVDQVDIDSGGEGVEESFEHTESENFGPDAQMEGEYLDEASANEPPPMPEGEFQGEDDFQQNDEFSANQQYDEFAQGDNVDGEFVDDGPGEWQEPDWVTANADGSVDIMPPEGVTVDPDAGIANFPVDVANEELPLPEDTIITPDGGLEMPLPEGAEYLQESNQLLIPQGSVSLDEIPEGIEAYEAPDGSVMVNLPDQGIEIDPESGTVHFDNHFANEFTPENVEILEDGSVNIQFPEDGVEYNDDGSIHMSAQASQFMDSPPPEYYGEMDYAEYQPDGSVNIMPPEGVTVEGGICEMPHDLANEHLEMPQEFELHADGTSSFQLGENVEYNADINGLIFPEGEIHLEEIPEGIDAHINPDGTTTVMLQDGMQYDAEANCVKMDNYWTNEVTPDNMQFSEDGICSIALPEGTEFYEDGSFNIPADHVDFMEQQPPEYVADCDWAEPTANGDYHMTPPEGFNVDPQMGELSCEHQFIDEHIPHPEEVQFNADGTMTVSLPDGTEFNDGQLKFPEGSMNINEIPPEVQPVLHEDGSITVTLQDGMEFNPDTNSVNLDNYWTNELSPEPVNYSPDGVLTVDLPQDCEFHDDGSFTIPEGHCDFIQDPDPAYCTQGPDWVEPNPDGSVSLVANEHFESFPEDGQIQMNADYINDGFEDYKPDGVTFNDDGTMTAQVPQGTLYDAEANALTFPQGEMHMNELPQELNAQLNDNGSITVNLQDGMDYNPETGSVHFDNYWTNELTPDCTEFTPEGQVIVDMPHDCHFYEDGSVSIPPESCDFIEQPYPEYVNEGPDWVNDNPDGSVTVMPPEGIEVNAQEGYLSMDFETAQAELGGDLIPEELTLNSDGTVSMSIPDDIQFEFDAQSNTFTLTETPENFNINEVPDFLSAEYDANGNVVVSLPEGVTFDADSGSLILSNELVNEMAPEPIEFTPEGEFKIHLPEDTQYFEDGFVISSDSADFLNDGQEGNMPQEEYQATQNAS